jgi:hypothetical protein
VRQGDVSRRRRLTDPAGVAYSARYRSARFARRFKTGWQTSATARDVDSKVEG